MAAVISAMATNCTPSLHGSSRLSRASSGASMPPPPPPPALAQKDAQGDTMFTDEEFQALMSGHCELLSFSDNDDLPSPLLSLQLQAQLLCRDDDARFQETPPPFALDDLEVEVEAPISDDDIERLAPLFCDEEIQALFCDEALQALCAAPEQQEQQASMQFSSPRSDDLQAGKKRMSSPPWPSCIADDDDDDGEAAAGPLPLPSTSPPPPPPTKKARTKTKRRRRLVHEPPPLPPRPIKKARTQTKSRSSSHEHAAAARAARLRHRLRRWHNTMATRILMRRFRAPELSRGRTALRCQCPELARLAADEHEPDRVGFGCCALHQDAMPEDRAWMYDSAQSHVPLVGGPGEVLVPAVSAGSSKAMVRQYTRWRRSVSMPSRFYVQLAVEKRLAQQQAA